MSAPTINAADVIARVRSRLGVIQGRAVYALRAAAARGAPSNPKTVEIMAKALEINEYAETIQLMLAGVEEDAANDSHMKELVALSEELDQVGAAVHRHMQPKQEPDGPRLERSSK